MTDDGRQGSESRLKNFQNLLLKTDAVMIGCDLHLNSTSWEIAAINAGLVKGVEKYE
jgi:hypothetical protein